MLLNPVITHGLTELVSDTGLRNAQGKERVFYLVCHFCPCLAVLAQGVLLLQEEKVCEPCERVLCLSKFTE